MKRSRGIVVSAIASLGLVAAVVGAADSGEQAASERGREALTRGSYLPPAWGLDAYAKARRFLGPDAPDPESEPEGYAKAFNAYFGLHPAPYPNDGLPMGLRRARRRDGSDVGLQLDCLICHGGSIGGQSYVGLGNTQLDLDAVLKQLTVADGQVPPPILYTLNTARGTNNAGQIAVVLLSLRNPDLSFRKFPLLTGASLPELDTPPWWILKKKRTKYYDGRTPARATRSNMQFYLGSLSAQEFKDLEPTFQDIDAYLMSLEPPKYPFAVDAAKAGRGREVFEANCVRCHGTYGEGWTYPNKIVPLDIVGTDPTRAKGISDRFIDHYNSSWFGEVDKADEVMTGYQAPPLDGLWATAPYLHNGSVPTLYHLLKSSARPSRFLRPPSTDFEHYDAERVGWKFEEVSGARPSGLSRPETMSLYDTSRWGLGNGGHTFGDKLSEEERTDLIEYLKTL
jgi:mono/diheme cytochrome c family protein